MLILKNGKFYKDNVEVPIEIGNKEQIALIKQYQKVIGDGVEIRVSINETIQYDIVAYWTCPYCSKLNCVENDFADDEPNDNEIESVLEDENYCCYSCSSRFEFKVETIDRKKKYKLILPNENED